MEYKYTMGPTPKNQQVNRNAATPASERAAKYERLGKDAPQTTITWSEVDGPTIKRSIESIVGVGDALTFGRTRDGGALVVTVLSGEKRVKLYGATAIEMNDLLAELIDATRL
jgi:hypothetical protein